jgi:hypothetical protein
VAHELSDHPCGECKACCTVKQVAEIVKPEGVACQHLCEKGCGIYKTKPKSCSDYNCIWRVGLFDFMGELGAEFRPDKCGLVFDVNDTHHQGQQMLVVREVVEGAIERRMSTLHTLCAMGYVIYLVEGERRRMMGPEEKVRAIQEAARRRLPLHMR